MSSTYTVPVIEDPDPTAWGLGATLAQLEGRLEIVLRHVEDELPSMTVDAAESLANGILELVRQARSAA